MLKQHLETYIHGIELDKEAHTSCLISVNNIAKKYEIFDVKWDILNENILTCDLNNGKMDFLIGNPPCVRVHNLGESYESIKQFKFAKSGMTDLYLVFYEIGIKMLNETGKLCFITPSSLFNSLAAKSFRRYVIEQNLLKSVVNLEHYQPFKVTTYTTIILLDKSHMTAAIDYYIYHIYLKEKKMNNSHFLEVCKDSFLKYIDTGSRSNGKFASKVVYQIKGH